LNAKLLLALAKRVQGIGLTYILASAEGYTLLIISAKMIMDPTIALLLVENIGICVILAQSSVNNRLVER